MTFTLGSASAAPAPERPPAASSPHQQTDPTNGTTNGKSPEGALMRYPGLAEQTQRICLRESEFSEEHVVRLMLQELRDRGFVDSFNQLQRESGYTLEDDTVTQFRESVLSGEWAEVERALASIGVEAQSMLNSARFTIKRQQFLELLEARKLKQALLVLQNELSALTDDIPQLHRLSSLLMCPSPADLYTASSWDGCQGRSRFQVLESLQTFISPRRMVPAHRMETLFKQSIRSQEANCEHHTQKAQPSLYIDHTCSAELFPPHLRISLRGHSNEVWYVAFSPDDRYLASASRDQSCIIWSTTDYSIVHRLEGHTGKISYLSWSPDSEYLVSASDDKKLLLWDVHSGKLRHTFTGHTETITACRWLSDGERFLSAGMDKKIIMWSAKGHKLKHIDTPRVHDIAISSDDKTMVVADDRENVYIYDLASVTLKHKLKETAGIMSLSLTADSRFCLVGLFKGELHLWDLRTQVCVREFSGYAQGPYVIRSGFAGVDDRFVVVGSEDSLVFVWNRNTGNLLARLKGHARTVNGFAWSTGLAALATISDDKTICVWPAYEGAPSCMSPSDFAGSTVASVGGSLPPKGKDSAPPSPALSQHTDEHDHEEEEDDEEDDDEGEEDEEEYGLRSRRHDSSDEDDES
ncbi:hypothetical protein EC988_001767, partial [Linderina pennispora]